MHLKLPSPKAGIQETPNGAIRQWFVSFAEAVRTRNLELGRLLFASDVIAFGTRAATAFGLEALVDEQWSYVWNSTRGFTFELNELHIGIEGNLCWAAVPWESQGIASDGKNFQRTGRATYILQCRRGRWLAIHSHHSLNPSPENLRKATR